MLRKIVDVQIYRITSSAKILPKQMNSKTSIHFSPCFSSRHHLRILPRESDSQIFQTASFLLMIPDLGQSNIRLLALLLWAPLGRGPGIIIVSQDFALGVGHGRCPAKTLVYWLELTYLCYPLFLEWFLGPHLAKPITPPNFSSTLLLTVKNLQIPWMSVNKIIILKLWIRIYLYIEYPGSFNE